MREPLFRATTEHANLDQKEINLKLIKHSWSYVFNTLTNDKVKKIFD